jgi:PHD/YefM family antitoxin component YafN of YafNO toxin-antitoxin module
MATSVRDIQTLTMSDFPRSPQELRELLRVAKRPIVVRSNGKAEFEVISAKGYQKLLQRVEPLETLEGLLESFRDIEEGNVIPLAEAFEQLQQRKRPSSPLSRPHS